ncbi:hypothetical protein TWF730_010309 [Orbilia blumenaviensis]|uniref:Transcription factor CBF/NF-Y/archaeal histone domain-containing protein n=1 Tax=Orbilia blumenaviensis TaxID=1796055 RepID=A0AAV9UMW5_9PEZI
MGYNTNAIPPKRKREDWDGTSYLPLARVRKIIKLDDDIDACTPAAAFLISVAAEEFIWHIAEQAHKMTKVEKKPRKNIQYKDLANAVARIDNLEFLSDVIPRTVPFGKAMMKKMGAGGKKASAGEGTSKEDSSAKGANVTNITGGEDEASDGGSPSSETMRLKDLHLSQPSGSGTKKGRKVSRDQDGDLTMQ